MTSEKQRAASRTAAQATQRELDMYEHQRRAQRVWASFASSAFTVLYASSVVEYRPADGDTATNAEEQSLLSNISESARVADLLLAQWEKRFGMSEEDRPAYSGTGSKDAL